MITILLLLLILVIIGILVTIGFVAWPIVAILAIGLLIDAIFLKRLFGKKQKKEEVK